MSRIPHILARITQRSALQSQSAARAHPHLPRAFSTTLISHSSSSHEHNLSSPTRPQPTSPQTSSSSSGAPTPTTHPTYFPATPARPSSRNFYRTHGRALFKALTLAFFTYQVLYWGWLTLETEEIKDGVRREIRGLEGEVRLLDEGRRGHGEAMKRVVRGGRRDEGGRERILEEGVGK